MAARLDAETRAAILGQVPLGRIIQPREIWNALRFAIECDSFTGKWMAERASNTSRVAIPKIIHNLWYQGESRMPERYHQYRSGWMLRHAGWKFMFWDESRMRELVRVEYPGFLDLYDGYPLAIQRMDAIRYFILNSSRLPSSSLT